jgi:ABC-type uncharacterized transport system substrate-binding protein
MVEHVVGIAVRTNPTDPAPTAYRTILENVLDEFGLSHETASNSGAKDVFITVRGLLAYGGDPNTGYPNMANDFTADKADVILVADAEAGHHMRNKQGGDAKKAVVSGVSFDPEHFGHVDSGHRHKPNKHVTGVLVGAEGLNWARLDLLKRVVPAATKIGVVRVKEVDFCSDAENAELTDAAATLGLTLVNVPVPAGNPPDFVAALTAAGDVHAYVVIRNPRFQYNRADLVVAIRGRNRPAMYPFTDFVDLSAVTNPGGMMSHGPDREAGMKRAAIYVVRLLRLLKGGGNADVSQFPFTGPVQYQTAICLGEVNRINAVGGLPATSKVTIPAQWKAGVDYVAFA